MKIDKSYAIGIPVAILMLPIILAGFVASWVVRYFEAGYGMAEIVYNEIAKWADK